MPYRSKVNPDAGVEMAHDRTVRTLEGAADNPTVLSVHHHIDQFVARGARRDLRRSPREAHEALARDDMPAREQHRRVLRRRLLLRDGARKDRMVAVRQRERDLNLGKDAEKEEEARQGTGNAGQGPSRATKRDSRATPQLRSIQSSSPS